MLKIPLRQMTRLSTISTMVHAPVLKRRAAVGSLFLSFLTYFKEGTSRLNSLKSSICQSSPSLTILVPLWFIIISQVFFHIGKALFSGFLQLKGNFVGGQNSSNYRGGAPLTPVAFQPFPPFNKEIPCYSGSVQ